MSEPPYVLALADRTAAIRGVVFDLDGTLYELGPLRRYLILRQLLSLRRLDRYTKTRKSLAGFDAGDQEALFDETLDRLDPKGTRRDRWRQWIREVYDPLVARGTRKVARARPGARSLLDALRRGGLKVALVSDYLGVDARLEALGIPPALFDVRIETEAHGAMKPAPRIGRLLLDRLGLPAEQLVMVGDRAFADARFAEAVGMAFLGVSEGEPSGPDWEPFEVVAGRLLAMLAGYGTAAGVEPGSRP